MARCCGISRASGRPTCSAEPSRDAGTLTVNVSGSFLIGLLATLADERGLITAPTLLFLVAGFLGGFTTSLCFSLRETYRLAHEGEMTGALLNVLLNLSLSLVCVWLGAGVGRVVER